MRTYNKLLLFNLLWLMSSIGSCDQDYNSNLEMRNVAASKTNSEIWQVVQTSWIWPNDFCLWRPKRNENPNKGLFAKREYSYIERGGLGELGSLDVHLPHSPLITTSPAATWTHTRRSQGFGFFYLHGADRRSRHSDSLGLGRQAGRHGGRRTHAQATHTRKDIRARTRHAIQKGGKENRHSRGWKCSKEGKNAAHPC